MTYTMLDRNQQPREGNTFEFEGYRYGDVNGTSILVDMPPGDGPRLHAHPYEEVFIVQEGHATSTVGSAALEVQSGQIVIVPPGVAHRFINSGDEPLRQIDIHRSKLFITEWLED